MSTRSSIFYQEETDEQVGLHLYYEMIEEDSPVCLEVSSGPFQMIIKVPPKLLEALGNEKPTTTTGDGG